MELDNMTPRRPYIFRAFYDWILDNELTPYIVVDTSVYGVLVPQEFIKDNQIVLNIAPQSVGQYLVNNEQIEFNARFSGIPQHIVVPMAAIEAIYAVKMVLVWDLRMNHIIKLSEKVRINQQKMLNRSQLILSELSNNYS